MENDQIWPEAQQILDVFHKGVLWPEGLIWRTKDDVLVYSINELGEEWLMCGGPYSQLTGFMRGDRHSLPLEVIFEAVDGLKKKGAMDVTKLEY